MIERTFPPLNIWWVRTQKFSSKLQAECSFTHPTNLLNIAPKVWEFSSFKKFVKQGFYQDDWCNFNDKNGVLNMDLE